MSLVAEPQFDDLFREVIIDHYRKPRHHGSLTAPTLQLEGMNPVCGDEVAIDVKLDGGRLADIAFHGQGCSISQASASMMTDAVSGRTVDEAVALAQRFRKLMMEGGEFTPDLGDIEALQGVAKYPVRVKCALLSWNVLRQGLEGVSRTED